MHNPIDEEAYKKNFLNQKCSINFAFCPNLALIVKEKGIEKMTTALKASGSAEGDIYDEDYRAISAATRFFYICYCLKFDQMQDYFYFQTFSKMGNSEVIHSEPLYGFYKKNDILKLLGAIDDYFLPNPHDKQIFDNVMISAPAPASFIISLMTTWTASKLMQFGDFYKADKKAQLASAKAIQILEKIINESTKKTKKPVEKKSKIAAKKKAKKNERRSAEKNKPVDKPVRKRKSKKNTGI